MHISKTEKKIQVNRRTRKPPHIKQALCLVSILSLIIVQAGALILRPVPVLASEGAAAYNVAGYILTLLTSYNTAITNQQVVNSIVSTFGNMDCATASSAQIETGLATIAQSTGFNLAPIFATTAEEAAEIASVYEGWGETAIAAASAGTNIEAGAKGLALAAAGGAGASVLPAVGGVVLPAAAATGLGIAGGFLIDHIRNAIIKYVKNAKPVSTPSDIMNYIPDSAYCASYIIAPSRTYFYYTNNPKVYVACVLEDSRRMVRYLYYNLNSSVVGFYTRASGYSNDSSIAANGIKTDSTTLKTVGSGFSVGTLFSSRTAADNYVSANRSNLKGGDVSPDIVGNNGNQTGTISDGSYTLPDVRPIYNPGTTIINYISPNDYQNLIDTANTNTNNGDINAETQGVDFDTFVDPYIQPVTNPEPNPNPDPNPTSVPQPTQQPIVGVNPVPDPQPTSAPLPTPSTEEQEQLPEGMTNPDWKEKFPFCIPYDLLAFMQIWEEARSAPRFEFDLSFGTNGRYGLGVVVIDLSPFDSAAQLLRLLQLILFIVGLAIGTHKLLNPSGGGGD